MVTIGKNLPIEVEEMVIGLLGKFGDWWVGSICIPSNPCLHIPGWAGVEEDWVECGHDQMYSLAEYIAVKSGQ